MTEYATAQYRCRWCYDLIDKDNPTEECGSCRTIREQINKRPMVVEKILRNIVSDPLVKVRNGYYD